MTSRPILPFAALVLSLLASCTADLHGNPSADGPANSGGGTAGPGTSHDPPGKLGVTRQSVADACEKRNGELGVGLTKLRRLSVAEFNNTVSSLFDAEYVDYKAELPDDEPMGPFVSNQTLAVRSQEARQYSRVAQAVADNVLESGTGFLGCSLPAGMDTTCIEQFVVRLAPLAFRRPLEPDEQTRLLDIYALGRDGIEGTEPNPGAGLHLLIRAIVGSPDLLYVVDRNVHGDASEVPALADAHTLVARLSLAFWNAPPDEELQQLAASGEIHEEVVYRAQVERLLDDERAQSNLARIFAQLTGVDELEEKEKDPLLFPQFTPELVEEMLAEQSAFVRSVVFEADSRWSTLLTTNYQEISPGLAELYGALASPDGSEVSLPEGQRQGLFTQAAYLSAHNKPAETSPVHLGINIREAILCETMLPPPANIDTTLPEVSGEIRTSRERFAAHETGPCKNCHQLIDPIGLAFENYDAIGAYRLTDNGAEIDPTGQIIDGQGGPDGPWFTGALELSQQLAESQQVHDCVSRQLLRATINRQESVLDACSALSVIESFDASDGNLRQLLSEIAHSESFKHVLLNPPGNTP